MIRYTIQNILALANNELGKSLLFWMIKQSFLIVVTHHHSFLLEGPIGKTLGNGNTH